MAPAGVQLWLRFEAPRRDAAADPTFATFAVMGAIAECVGRLAGSQYRRPQCALYKRPGQAHRFVPRTWISPIGDADNSECGAETFLEVLADEGADHYEASSALRRAQRAARMNRRNW